MKFKAMKFNIGKGNHRVSEAVQEILFNLGYVWMLGATAPQHVTEPYLLADKHGTISYCDCARHFDASNAPTINIEWMKPEKRGTVIIGGKTYYEDELAEALSKIKEVEQ